MTWQNTISSCSWLHWLAMKNLTQTSDRPMYKYLTLVSVDYHWYRQLGFVLRLETKDHWSRWLCWQGVGHCRARPTAHCHAPVRLLASCTQWSSRQDDQRSSFGVQHCSQAIHWFWSCQSSWPCCCWPSFRQATHSLNADCKIRYFNIFLF